MTKLAILHFDEADEYKKGVQAKFPDLVIKTARDEASLGDFIPEMDIILTFRVSDDLLKKAHKLQWIQSLATGVDYIVNHPSLRKDTIVTSTRGIHGPQMSEMAFLHMLTLARKFHEQVLNQARAVWEAWPAGLLWKKKVAILGVGVIGEEIAKKAKAFGMTVYGIDIVKREPRCRRFLLRPRGHTEGGCRCRLLHRRCAQYGRDHPDREREDALYHETDRLPHQYRPG